jgi:hypothetical protein
MEAYKTAAKIGNRGQLRLSNLPFSAGEEVEVILLRLPKPPRGRETANRYPLRGQPFRYDRPLEPVAEDDWEALS